MTVMSVINQDYAYDCHNHNDYDHDCIIMMMTIIPITCSCEQAALCLPRIALLLPLARTGVQLFSLSCILALHWPQPATAEQMVSILASILVSVVENCSILVSREGVPLGSGCTMI